MLFIVHGDKRIVRKQRLSAKKVKASRKKDDDVDGGSEWDGIGPAYSLLQLITGVWDVSLVQNSCLYARLDLKTLFGTFNQDIMNIGKLITFP